MFRATMCPSSGETTVWYAGWSETSLCIPDSHPHRITSTKCRTNTVVSPDAGHIVAWNV